MLVFKFFPSSSELLQVYFFCILQAQLWHDVRHVYNILRILALVTRVSSQDLSLAVFELRCLFKLCHQTCALEVEVIFLRVLSQELLEQSVASLSFVGTLARRWRSQVVAAGCCNVDSIELDAHLDLLDNLLLELIYLVID